MLRLIFVIMSILYANGHVYAETSQQPKLIDNAKLYIMPVNDVRPSEQRMPSGDSLNILLSPYIPVDASKILSYGLMRPFFMRGFEVEVTTDTRLHNNDNSLSIESNSIEQLASQGPQDANYLLFVDLNDTSITYAGIYAKANVSITTHLIKKKPPKLLWKYTAQNSADAIGAVNSALIKSYFTNAIYNTVDVMATNVPEYISTDHNK